MNELTLKKEIKFNLIPPELEGDFKEQVMNAYFSLNRLDLHNIGYLTEEFCIYAYSLKETGDAHLLSDDPNWSKYSKDIVDISFNELLSDIFEIMRFYNLFHAWNDIGNDDKYDLIHIANSPVKAVW